MTPQQWNETVCDLLVGKGFPTQERYARQLFPQVVRRLKRDVRSSMEFRLLFQSFSYAHQLFGDLKGRVNLVCNCAGSFVPFLSAYLEYVERPCLVIDALTLAAEEAASWDRKDFDVSDVRLPYAILLDADKAFLEYRNLAALQGALSRQNPHQSGCILVSSKALDTLPPVVSADCTKTRSYQNLEIEILDIPGIVLEKQKEKTRG